VLRAASHYPIINTCSQNMFFCSSLPECRNYLPEYMETMNCTISHGAPVEVGQTRVGLPMDCLLREGGPDPQSLTISKSHNHKSAEIRANQPYRIYLDSTTMYYPDSILSI
jgi:hypothetical protein